jgi:hypothetical protein
MDCKPLKIVGTLVGSQGQDKRTVAIASNERLDGVVPQVRTYCGRIEGELFVQCARIPLCSITNVSSFSISNGYYVAWNHGKCFLENVPAPLAQGFVECKIQLVSADKIAGGFDDLSIEPKHGIFGRAKVSWQFCRIGVKTHAEKRRALALNLQQLINEFHLQGLSA